MRPVISEERKSDIKVTFRNRSYATAAESLGFSHGPFCGVVGSRVLQAPRQPSTSNKSWQPRHICDGMRLFKEKEWVANRGRKPIAKSYNLLGENAVANAEAGVVIVRIEGM